MKLSVSAYRAHASAHKKILSSGYHSQLNYGSTVAAASSSGNGAFSVIRPYSVNTNELATPFRKDTININMCQSDTEAASPSGTSSSGQENVSSLNMSKTYNNEDNKSNALLSDCKHTRQRKFRMGDGDSGLDSDWTRSNQRWMKLRTTVQISSAIQKKPPLKREDSFLKRFSTRQISDTQETIEDTGSESTSGDVEKLTKKRRRYLQKRSTVVNPDDNFYFYWLMVLTASVLYNLWTLIVRQSFPELQKAVPSFWTVCDILTDLVFIFDVIVQLRTGYLEQGLMVYDDKKLACHYLHSTDFFFDILALVPLDLIQLQIGVQPLLRFTRFFKAYRSIRFYYIVESRTVWPNLWRVVNLIHILLILAHWFGCFYYLLSEAEGFQGDWVYPHRPGDYATLTRKYLGSLYWSTLTLTTIGDLPTPETNAEYVFTILSYLIGVFIFATIVGQVGNVITNRNANRLEFERLLDGAKTYMRHHKVPGGMKRRVLRWYDYSWSRGRIQGGGDINTALGLLPDKLKTELALHVNLSVLKKVSIFQECQPEFLHDLVLKMKAYIFTPGDSICRKGEVAREMFIIADGILEVISETGKVLTTMKAGDFFGEIGILNLDGLNKRTADVRSVGYSELFSLSREDVLSAMKDYPEAQQILQTLGRKRLMEVRCVNRKYANNQADTETSVNPKAHQVYVNQSDSSENSAPKKIADKIKKNAKGLKDVLKQTRTSHRNTTFLELQPLQNNASGNGKSALRRMSRVCSDENDDTIQDNSEYHDKTPSPIGAGLPLLQRLRLLKEKQDREERTVISSPMQQSPPNSHVMCALSPQASIQEEPEQEINERLNLNQQMQQLTTKSDPHFKNSSETMSASTLPSNISASLSLVHSFNNYNKQNSCIRDNENLTNKTHHSSAKSPSAIPQMKPIMKVSFKQRVQKLHSDDCISSSIQTVKKLHSKDFSAKNNTLHLVPATSSEQKTVIYETNNTPSIISSNVTKSSVSSKSVLQQPPVEDASNIKALKCFSGNSDVSKCRSKICQSVFDLSPEYIDLPFVKRLKVLKERQKLIFFQKSLRNRSFSLDKSTTKTEISLSESLNRYLSNASEIQSHFTSAYKQNPKHTNQTCTDTFSLKPRISKTCLEFTKFTRYDLLSEDQKLKSILKNVHKEKKKYNKKLRESSIRMEGHRAHFLLAQPEGSPASDKATIDENKLNDNNHCTGYNLNSTPNNLNSSLANNVVISKTLSVQSNWKPQLDVKYSINTIVPKIGGLIQKQECFNEILCGINNLIKSHITEMHAKYETQFAILESEVKKRDAIINKLQVKLDQIEHETISASSSYLTTRKARNPEKLNQMCFGLGNETSKCSSSESSAALLLMHGNSLNTIFSTSTPFEPIAEYSVCPSTSSTLTEQSKPRASYHSYSKLSSVDEVHKNPENNDVIISNADNISAIPENEIMETEQLSSSSSSASILNLKKTMDTETDLYKKKQNSMELPNFYHNDWEVKMLAAEMAKQERKRGYSFSENMHHVSGFEDYSFHRHHRKISYTETECSETDVEDVLAPIRPRACSLDQFNLKYGTNRERVKDMGIDHDKDSF